MLVCVSVGAGVGAGVVSVGLSLSLSVGISVVGIDRCRRYRLRSSRTDIYELSFRNSWGYDVFIISWGIYDVSDDVISQGIYKLVFVISLGVTTFREGRSYKLL